LNGCPGIDTDGFMTAEEIAAVRAGRYTQQMRLANIRRYCAHARTDPSCSPHAALADGLPTNEARHFVLDQFPPGEAALVLVSVPRLLWEERLARRAGNVVDVGVHEAEAYIAEHWQEPSPDLHVYTVENSDDAEAVDSRLRALFVELTGRSRA
jgi:hypothetical protein